MSWQATIILICVLIIAFAIPGIYLTRAYKKKKDSDKPMHITVPILPWLCVGALILCLAFTLITVTTAYSRGYFGQDASLAQLKDASELAPNDQSATLPNEITSSIVVIYKFGCPDCEAIYNDLYQDVDNIDIPTYYVSSRSDRGHTLCVAYDINDVPTALAYNEDGSVLQKKLYYVDDEENSIYDADAFARLVEWVNTTTNAETHEE